VKIQETKSAEVTIEITLTHAEAQRLYASTLYKKGKRPAALIVQLAAFGSQLAAALPGVDFDSDVVIAKRVRKRKVIGPVERPPAGYVVS
jgi:hypothetical protein